MNVTKVVLLTKTAMPMENVLVNPMLLVTNVMLSYQAIMTLMIQKVLYAKKKNFYIVRSQFIETRLYKLNPFEMYVENVSRLRTKCLFFMISKLYVIQGPR